MKTPPPFLTNYRRYKEEHPKEVVLTRLSHPFVYAAFDDDAVAVAKACQGFTFTRVIAGERIRTAYINTAGIVGAIAAMREADLEPTVLED